MPEPSRFTPTPSTQLRDCQGWFIRLTCRPCHRAVALQLVQIGRTLNEPTLPLSRAARRFRCCRCGQPPVQIDLVSGLGRDHEIITAGVHQCILDGLRHFLDSASTSGEPGYISGRARSARAESLVN